MKEGLWWSGAEESPDARQRGCSATAGGKLAAQDALQRPLQRTVSVHEAVDQPQLMVCIASSRLDTRAEAAQPTESLACLSAAKNAHCQQHAVQQDASPEAGNRLVFTIEAGSREGRSGGDLCAAAATMQKATIMRSMIRAKACKSVTMGTLWGGST